jgi:hypothetical protein
MAHNKSPAPNGERASCVSFADWTREARTLSAYRAQYIATVYGVRAELTSLLASFAFGEADNV